MWCTRLFFKLKETVISSQCILVLKLKLLHSSCSAVLLHVFAHRFYLLYYFLFFNLWKAYNFFKTLVSGWIKASLHEWFVPIHVGDCTNSRKYWVNQNSYRWREAISTRIQISRSCYFKSQVSSYFYFLHQFVKQLLCVRIL